MKVLGIETELAAESATAYVMGNHSTLSALLFPAPRRHCSARNTVRLPR